ncbi:MAG: response regulator [Myxococcota bacterium]|nr:response regulator [Myxococcota bacterium]
MKRILFATGDRSFSMFLAETLLDKQITVEQPMLRSTHWDICRAHSALELSVLVNHGRRQFDIVVVDQDLPGPDCLEVIADLRRFEQTQDVAIFVITERGKHQLVRRIASERYFVSGFIEKPVSPNSLRASLSHVGQRSRILVIDKQQSVIEDIALMVEEVGYDAFGLRSGEKAMSLKGLDSFDVLLCGPQLDDMSGAELCEIIKQSPQTQHLPFFIFGSMEQVAAITIAENAYRADGFIKAPISTQDLLQKLSAVTGRVRPSTIPPSDYPNYVKQTVKVSIPDDKADTAPQRAVPSENDTQRPGHHQPRKPQSAQRPETGKSTSQQSPNEATKRAPRVRTTKVSTQTRLGSSHSYKKQSRATRRVPCRISVQLMNGTTVHESETLNISNGGIMVSTDIRVEMGNQVELTFSLPNLEETINATGKIAWFSSPPVRSGEPKPLSVAGIKFNSIKNKHLEAIVDYVNNVAKVVYVAP